MTTLQLRDWALLIDVDIDVLFHGYTLRGIFHSKGLASLSMCSQRGFESCDAIDNSQIYLVLCVLAVRHRLRANMALNTLAMYSCKKPPYHTNVTHQRNHSHSEVSDLQR